MKWRTIPQAMKEIEKHDPDTVLTEKALRRMAKNKQISTLKNGRYILVNIEELGGVR